MCVGGGVGVGGGENLNRVHLDSDCGVLSTRPGNSRSNSSRFGPFVWNSLPLHVRNARTIDIPISVLFWKSLFPASTSRNLMSAVLLDLKFANKLTPA